MPARKRNPLSVVGPGLLVAATGVGAGDLATAALTGSKLGLSVLWAVVVGAGVKFQLNEGLARWQLATGETLLEGCIRRFGRPVQAFFGAYLFIWSFFVGSALMSACGVTAHAIFPLLNPQSDKILYGLVHSALAVVLVRAGGYRLFEIIMRGCIGVMFLVVTGMAVCLVESWGEVAHGLTRPVIPVADKHSLAWTIALIGGVGGTLTVLCYGYWIREERRCGVEFLRVCRIDLATGYAMTAVFGLAMVIIGSTITVPGSGATLVVNLAERMQTLPTMRSWGPAAKWAFLIGAWGAVFSSLLGVWQSVPYLFADFCSLAKRRAGDPPPLGIDTSSPAYRWYLVALAVVPAAGLVGWDFAQVQLLYAVIGAAFMPLLALALLVLNGQSRWIGLRYRNSWITSILLVFTLMLFMLAAWIGLRSTP